MAIKILSEPFAFYAEWMEAFGVTPHARLIAMPPSITVLTRRTSLLGRTAPMWMARTRIGR